MDEEETIKVQQEAKMSEEEAVVDAEKAGEGEQARNAEVGKAAGAIEPASVQGRLMRIAGPPIPNGQSQIVAPPRSLGSGKVVAASKGPARGKGGKAVPVKPTEEYDPDVDPSNPRLLDVEGIVHKNGLSVYPDQAGRLWTGLATYWIKRGEFDRASSTFEKGLASVVTVRDFTQIFDAYAEFSETMISTLMEALGDEDNLEDEEFDVEDTEQELDERMKDFEKLMDRRPFIVNEVLLRRNKDEVVEWEKRIALYSAAAQAQVESEGEGADGAGAGAGQEDGDARVIKTYLEAIDAINPRKATGPLYPIYVNFAKFYEEGGTAGQAEPNLAEARKIFEKATRVPFKDVDELAEIWCEWAEMELRNE
jgi:pre-mRNA-splicing factor SYF1